MSHFHPPLVDRLLAQRPHIPVTSVLVVANLLVFAAMVVQGAGLWHTANGIQLAWGANFSPATQDGQWWRLGSAMFLHFGLLHLALNMLSLWDGGRLVERMYGPGRFLVLYGASGLAGNLASLVAHGNQAVSGGASGAIFGVYGALLSYLWLERHGLDRAEFRGLFWGAAAFTGLAIGFGLLVTGIDNAAHGGGLLAGVLAGLALGRPFHRVPSARRIAQGLAGLTLIGLVGALLLNLPAPRYRWSEEQRAQREILAFLDEDARISAQWGSLLDQARRREETFDALAGRIEDQVAAPYEDSFEQLANLQVSRAVPSAPALMALREYARIRRDASRELVEGLRTQDMDKVRESLESARRAVGRVQEGHQERP